MMMLNQVNYIEIKVYKKAIARSMELVVINQTHKSRVKGNTNWNFKIKLK